MQIESSIAIRLIRCAGREMRHGIATCTTVVSVMDWLKIQNRAKSQDKLKSQNCWSDCYKSVMTMHLQML
ncbi:hypothetical protein F444_00384 [Phytophthora nicotianae P1976]|uniref:Uncharacterized protein n=1 Tax=Phytophthora nicotianae P1976 TaxID=1317066 RepID=A0A081B4H6_PHYNI|nr:hypothetical protein F444_00384 [Phytophthora nicotianae P1976]